MSEFDKHVPILVILKPEYRGDCPEEYNVRDWSLNNYGVKGISLIYDETGIPREKAVFFPMHRVSRIEQPVSKTEAA